MCDSDSGLSLSMNDSQTDVRCQNLVFIRVTCPELDYESVQNFSPNTIIFDMKLTILRRITKNIRDKWNFGLFLPPSKGKAGKFLQEERFLGDYPFDNSVGHLELKYKQRIYRMLKTNANKLKKIHVRSNLRQFLDCVRSGDVEKVSKWLNKGLDPNFQWKDTGDTPLITAIKLEKPREMIMALVAGGAHLDYRSTDTMTPLHRAAAIGNYEAIKVFLDLGQSPNTRDQYHLTPLYYAVLNDTIALCTERLLYDHAILGTADEAGLQEIHQACRFGRVQHLETLIFYGADINSQTSKNGNTPLHICAFTGQEACARLLLFRGADRTLLNRAGHTPYQQAVLAQHCAVAELINTFESKDVVPIRGIPKRNERRRPCMDCYSQQRCSSLGRLATSTNELDGQISLSSHSSIDTGDCVSSTVSRESEAQFCNSQMRTSVSGYCLDTILSGPVNRVDKRERTNGSPIRPRTEKPNPVSLSQSSNNLGYTGMYRKPDNVLQDYSATLRITGQQDPRKSSILNGHRGRPTLESMWVLPTNENASDTASIFSGASSIKGGQSTCNYGSTSSTLQAVLSGQANILELDTSHLPRMIVLQKGPRGFGFVIRGRRGVPGKFQPTIEFPALQYLEKIEIGSAADRAGLKPGDYILEVNGINVTTMSHEAVVQLIRNSGDILSMKVITVESGGPKYSSASLDNGDQPLQQVASYKDSAVLAIDGRTEEVVDRGDVNEVYSNSTTSMMYSKDRCMGYRLQNDPCATISRATIGRKHTASNDLTVAAAAVSEAKSSPALSPPTLIPSTQHSLPPPPPLLPPTATEGTVGGKTAPPPTFLKQLSGQQNQVSCNGQSDGPAKTNTCRNSQIEATALVGNTTPLPSPPPPTSPPTGRLNSDQTSRGASQFRDFQGLGFCRPETDASPPLPPPPPLDSPNGYKKHECSSPSSIPGMSTQVRDSTTTEPSNVKDARATFEDHLRQAVERRRRKLEMTSSEEEDTRSKIDVKDLQSNTSNNSVLYSSSGSPCKSPSQLQNGSASPMKGNLRRNLSISQTGESSFKAAAEKFHAKALARSMAISTNTIPPPENFKDRTNSSSVVQIAKTFSTQSSTSPGACVKKSFSTYFSQLQTQSTHQADSRCAAEKSNGHSQVENHLVEKHPNKSTIPPPPPLPSRPPVQYKNGL